MIVQGTQVIFTTLNSPKWPKRNVPGGKNCQTFWMVMFSIQFDLDAASGQKLEGNVTTLHKLGLRRGKRYWMMMMIIWKEKRSKWNWLNLGIMDARNVSSGVLPAFENLHRVFEAFCFSSRSPNKMLVLCILYLLAVSLYLKFLCSTLFDLNPLRLGRNTDISQIK